MALYQLLPSQTLLPIGWNARIHLTLPLSGRQGAWGGEAES